MRHFLLLLILTLLPAGLWASPDDEDFVRAYFVVIDEGDVMYSSVGHACIHLECPEHDLDYFFSYESEDVKEKVLAFLSGNLKMGMMAIGREDFLKEYREEGRGVQEYELHLPIEAKKRMWEILDNRVMEGMNLPYDFLKRGCTHACLDVLISSLDTLDVNWGECPERLENKTLREIVRDNTQGQDWIQFQLCTLAGTDTDIKCGMLDKIIIPKDMAALCQQARLQGHALADATPHVLLKGNKEKKSTPVTPLALSIAVLLAAIVSFLYKPLRLLAWIPVTLSFILGLFISYLVCFSTLPATSWNWLIIPFFPLCLPLWKWRKYWALPFAAITVAWCAGVMKYPHLLVLPAHIVLALSTAIGWLVLAGFRLKRTK